MITAKYFHYQPFLQPYPWL